MDKINVALSTAEDNAVAIRELNKSLLRRTKCRFVVGQAANGDTSFGRVTSDGTVGVVITFNGSSTVILNFGDTFVRYSASPIVAVLPAGDEELKIAAVVQNAHALILGG